jgi:hypothetical protein
MNSTRGHWLTYATAITIALLGSASTASHAADNETRGNDGQHKGWYKKDKVKSPVSVPEPGTIVLLVTGLVAAMSVGRKGPKV